MQKYIWLHVVKETSRMDTPTSRRAPCHYKSLSIRRANNLGDTVDLFTPGQVREVKDGSLRVLVWGRKGTGKTTLVKNIMGREIPPTREETQDSSLPGINEYSGKVRDEDIIIYDVDELRENSPSGGELELQAVLQALHHLQGLSSPSSTGSTRLLCQTVDLFILCLPLNKQFSKSDIKFLKECNKSNIDWNNVIVALTLADSVDLKSSQDQTHAQHFDRKVEQRVSEIKALLQKEKLVTNKATLEQIQFVPTTNTPAIPLPTGKDWLTQLWLAIVDFSSLSGQLQNLILRNESEERVALFPYEARNIDELSLIPNDVITNIQWYADGVWAFGTCKERTGLFHPLLLQWFDPRARELKREQKQKNECKEDVTSKGYIYQQGGISYAFRDRLTSFNYHECPICLQLPSDPVLTQCCGRSFCGSCIVQTTGESCPLCRTTSEMGYTTYKDQKTERQIRDRTIYCPHYCYGCQWEGELRNLDNHISRKCQYHTIACDRGCGEEYQRYLEYLHSNFECPLREVICHFCYLGDESECKMTHRELTTTHWRECPHWPLRCPNRCKERSLKQGSLETHLAQDCPKHIIPCAYKDFGCGFETLREKMTHHLQEAMPQHLEIVAEKYRQSLKEIEGLSQTVKALQDEMAEMKK